MWALSLELGAQCELEFDGLQPFFCKEGALVVKVLAQTMLAQALRV